MEMQVKRAGKGTGAENRTTHRKTANSEMCWVENLWRSKPGGDRGMRWIQELGDIRAR